MREFRRKWIAAAAVASTLASPLGTTGIHADEHARVRTATPIKHVIVIYQENRSFDEMTVAFRAPRRSWPGATIQRLRPLWSIASSSSSVISIRAWHSAAPHSHRRLRRSFVYQSSLIGHRPSAHFYRVIARRTSVPASCVLHGWLIPTHSPQRARPREPPGGAICGTVQPNEQGSRNAPEVARRRSP